MKKLNSFDLIMFVIKLWFEVKLSIIIYGQISCPEPGRCDLKRDRCG